MDKVIFFTENHKRGGGNRYMIDLINSLESLDLDIILYSNKGGVYSEDLSRLRGSVEVRSLPVISRTLLAIKYKILSKCSNKQERLVRIAFMLFEPLFYLYNMGCFFLLCYRVRPACVVACNGGYPAAKSCLTFLMVASLLKIPTLLSIVSMPLWRRNYMMPYEIILDKILWQATDLVVVNAKAIADSLAIQRGMPINKSRIIYNGLEDLLPIGIPSRVSSYSNDSDFVIGMVSRMDKEKGVLYLFEAFIILQKKYPNMKLSLVGDGSVYEDLSSSVNRLRMQNSVKMPGYYKGDIESILNTFDIYVFPSLWEGMPYSILEAMRSGCVIVSTDVGGIKEAITDGVDGLLIKPGSVVAITSAVDRLIGDPGLCTQLAENARKTYEKKFALQEMEQQFQKVLAALIPDMSYSDTF